MAVPDTSIAVQLDPQQPAAEGFRAVLVGLKQAIDANWQGSIADTDVEFLHYLRIALRRTRSVLGHARGVLPGEPFDHFRDEFRWLAGLTGPTRDLDVFIIEWHRYVDGLDLATTAALVPVLERVRRHRRNEFASFVEGAQSERAAALLGTWSAELATTHTGDDPWGRHSRRRLGRVVADRIESAQHTLIEHGDAITEDSPGEDLHEMRKDAKKLRYLIECFAGLLPTKETKRFVRRLKGLQDNLGEHQDADVHAAHLCSIAEEFSHERVGAGTLVALGRLIERIEAGAARSRAEFAERFADYASKPTRRAIKELVRSIR